MKYLLTKSGPIATCGCEALLFSKTGINPKSAAADFQIQFIPGIFNEERVLKRNYFYLLFSHHFNSKFFLFPLKK